MIALGMQDYETDKSTWPVNKPTTKREAIQQTSGEAQYCNDLPPYPGEVFCAFVLTEVSNGRIEGIDASKALNMKGVLAFFTAKDVPGKNLAISAASKEFMLPEDESLFVEKDILYAGQPVGVIVAATHNLANQAAMLVKVKYSEPLKKKPVLTLEDAIAIQDKTRFIQTIDAPAQRKGRYLE